MNHHSNNDHGDSNIVVNIYIYNYIYMYILRIPSIGNNVNDNESCDDINSFNHVGNSNYTNIHGRSQRWLISVATFV